PMVFAPSRAASPRLEVRPSFCARDGHRLTHEGDRTGDDDASTRGLRSPQPGRRNRFVELLEALDLALGLTGFGLPAARAPVLDIVSEFVGGDRPIGVR